MKREAYFHRRDTEKNNNLSCYLSNLLGLDRHIQAVLADVQWICQSTASISGNLRNDNKNSASLWSVFPFSAFSAGRVFSETRSRQQGDA